MADQQNRFFHRKKIMTIFFICALVLIGLFMRLLYLMVWRADYYEEAATRLHERERSIKAARGRILDRNGVVLADNKTVCTVSVIHNQITEPEKEESYVQILSWEAEQIEDWNGDTGLPVLQKKECDREKRSGIL